MHARTPVPLWQTSEFTSVVSSNHPHAGDSRSAHPTMLLTRLCPHLSYLLGSTIPLLMPSAMTTISVASCSHSHSLFSAGSLSDVFHRFCGSRVSCNTLGTSGEFFFTAAILTYPQLSLAIPSSLRTQCYQWPPPHRAPMMRTTPHPSNHDEWQGPPSPPATTTATARQRHFT